MGYDTNPYYTPEATGLVTVGAIDTAGSYEFNIIAVWHKPETGQVFIASDSGCSCPVPFDEVQPEPVSKAEAIRRVRAHRGWGEAPDPATVESLVRKIRELSIIPV